MIRLRARLFEKLTNGLVPVSLQFKKSKVERDWDETESVMPLVLRPRRKHDETLIICLIGFCIPPIAYK